MAGSIGRSRRRRATRTLVAVICSALLAAAWGTTAAQADAARDEIASKWGRFTAMAVAQGIGYQYTSSGDALASGARERWGGAMSGSVPYGYAMTSDSRSAGIASVFWPGFVASHYKDAIPILADTVPFAGLKTPDNVVDGIKAVAGAAPAYPFIAATSGAKADEYKAMPPTQIPGGTVSGVTMRCDPEAASVHCSGNVAKAQLGDKPEAPSLVAEGIDTVADAILTEHEVRSVSTVNVANLNVLGSIQLRNIRAVATNVSNGNTSDVKRAVAVGEATVAGQAVTIDNQGVTLAGSPAMKQADYDNANKQFRDSLSAAGITIRLFGGAQKTEEGSGTTDEGEALYIGLKLPEYGVPDSFFYLNYWIGGTVNTAFGVPLDTPQNSADDTSDSATPMPATPADGNAATPEEARGDAIDSGPLRLTFDAGPAEPFGSSFFSSLSEAPVGPAVETTASPGNDEGAPSAMTMQAVPANQTSTPPQHQGILVGLLGLSQVLGLAVIAVVGRARVLARQGV